MLHKVWHETPRTRRQAAFGLSLRVGVHAARHRCAHEVAVGLWLRSFPVLLVLRGPVDWP